MIELVENKIITRAAKVKKKDRDTISDFIRLLTIEFIKTLEKNEDRLPISTKNICIKAIKTHALLIHRNLK